MNTPPSRPALETSFAPLVDGFSRTHTDLRISLTDRCSLRCTYCMPESGIPWLANNNILTADEIERVARVFVGAGVTSIRLTGGEPLLRPDLVTIVSRLSALSTPLGDAIEISMTTNGIGLEGRIDNLIAAGLTRVNISLDTLRADRFVELTRRDRLADVLAGIAAVRERELAPLKLNAVAMRGINDDELCELVDFANSMGAQMRFIEQMPLDISHTWDRSNLLSGDDILSILGTRFELTALPARGNAPAELYAVDGGPHTVGVIASVTAPFCGTCDRIRLTADGQVRNCLFARTGNDLREGLRNGCSDEELAQIIRSTVGSKKAGHDIDNPGFQQPDRGMNAIGG